MGQVLHVSATTAEAQHSQDSLRALSARYGINQKIGNEVEKTRAALHSYVKGKSGS